MSWHDFLRPASFRGAEFKVDVSSRSGGRRGVNFQYPKRETPSDEDMGRQSLHWNVEGYVIGLDYISFADDLEDALLLPGHGMLVHPTMGEMTVRCERYTRTESKDRGGLAAFSMSFVEKGADATELVSEATQQSLSSAASNAATTASTTANNDLISV